MTDRKVTLYHSPNTRSPVALILLGEIGAPYGLRVLNTKAGEQREPAHLAVKVPPRQSVSLPYTEEHTWFRALGIDAMAVGIATQRATGRRLTSAPAFGRHP